MAAGKADRGTPLWMTHWSPLRPLASLPRELPHVTNIPDLVQARAPRVGFSWTTGTPAGLALEVDNQRAQLTVNVLRDEGPYRRPLDPNGVTVLQLAGVGWRPLGERAAVAGRIVFDRTGIDDAGNADLLQPYISDPITLVDTTSPEMARTRAKLEGAIGWAFGAWAFGVAVGIETERPTTKSTPFPRIGRSSTPGVGLGISRTIPASGVRVAAYGRWLGGSETVILQARPGGSTAFVLTGFNEPDPLHLEAPPASLFRRVQRRAWSTGVSLGGSFGPSPWVLFAERAWRRNHQFTQLIPEPPTDRWRADGWTYGAGVQRVFRERRWLVTGNARLTTLEGEATRADLSGTVFRADEKHLTGWVELRYTLPVSPWRWAVRIGTRYFDRVRRDFLAETRAEIEEWNADVAVAVARWFGSTALAVGAGVALVTPIAAIPDPGGLGPVYELFVAREQSFYATPSIPVAVRFGVRHNISPGNALVLTTSGERLSARSTPPAIPFTPTGKRTVWRVSLGVVLER